MSDTDAATTNKPKLLILGYDKKAHLKADIKRSCLQAQAEDFAKRGFEVVQQTTGDGDIDTTCDLKEETLLATLEKVKPDAIFIFHGSVTNLRL